MSKNILTKLVELYAPETVREELSKINVAADAERRARNERAMRENDLLKTIDKALKQKAIEVPVCCLA